VNDSRIDPALYALQDEAEICGKFYEILMNCRDKLRSTGFVFHKALTDMTMASIPSQWTSSGQSALEIRECFNMIGKQYSHIEFCIDQAKYCHAVITIHDLLNDLILGGQKFRDAAYTAEQFSQDFGNIAQHPAVVRAFRVPRESLLFQSEAIPPLTRVHVLSSLDASSMDKEEALEEQLLALADEYGLQSVQELGLRCPPWKFARFVSGNWAKVTRDAEREVERTMKDLYLADCNEKMHMLQSNVEQTFDELVRTEAVHSLSIHSMKYMRKRLSLSTKQFGRNKDVQQICEEVLAPLLVCIAHRIPVKSEMAQLIRHFDGKLVAASLKRLMNDKSRMAAHDSLVDLFKTLEQDFLELLGVVSAHNSPITFIAFLHENDLDSCVQRCAATFQSQAGTNDSGDMVGDANEGGGGGGDDADDDEDGDAEKRTNDWLERVMIALEDEAEHLTETSAEEDNRLRGDNGSAADNMALLKLFAGCEKRLCERYNLSSFEKAGHGSLLSFVEGHMQLRVRQVMQQYLVCSSSGQPDDGCLLSVPARPLRVIQSYAPSAVESGLMQRLLSRFRSLDSELTGELERGHSGGSFDPLCDAVAQVMSSHLKAASSPKQIQKAARMTLSGAAAEMDVGLMPTACEAGLSRAWGKLEQEKRRNAVNLLRDVPGTAATVAKIALRSTPTLGSLRTHSRWGDLFEESCGDLRCFLLEQQLLKCGTGELDEYDDENQVVGGEHNESCEGFESLHVIETCFDEFLRLPSVSETDGGRSQLSKSVQCRDARETAGLLVKCVVDQGGAHTASLEYYASVLTIEAPTDEVYRFLLDVLHFLPVQLRRGVGYPVLVSPCMARYGNMALNGLLRMCNSAEEQNMLFDFGLEYGHASFLSALKERRLTEPAASKGLKESSAQASTSMIDGSGDSDADAEHARSAPANEPPLPLLLTDVAPPSEASNAVLMTHGDNASASLAALAPPGDATPASVQANLELISDIRKMVDPERNNPQQQECLVRALEMLSADLYSHDIHFVLELVQNADDNNYADGVTPTLDITLTGDAISFRTNELGFMQSNVRAICNISRSTKSRDTAGYIGNKGVGFKSVFKITATPIVHSNNWHFKFDSNDPELGYIMPRAVPAPSGWQSGSGTLIELPLLLRGMESSTKSSLPQDSLLTMDELRSRLSEVQPSMLLFLHRLRTIRITTQAVDGGTVSQEMLRIDDSNDTGCVRIQYRTICSTMGAATATDMSRAPDGEDRWWVVDRGLIVPDSAC
jgi:hypothetical protein